jgi:hypothetical protein
MAQTVGELVSVTINGVKKLVPAGTTNFQNLCGNLGVPTAKSLSVVPPSLSTTTVGGNSSYHIMGGEVITSS